jgi:hypothetical protein
LFILNLNTAFEKIDNKFSLQQEDYSKKDNKRLAGFYDKNWECGVPVPSRRKADIPNKNKKNTVSSGYLAV